MRGTVLNVFHLLGQVILSLQPPQKAVLFYSRLIDEEFETQRNKIIWPSILFLCGSLVIPILSSLTILVPPFPMKQSCHVSFSLGHPPQHLSCSFFTCVPQFCSTLSFQAILDVSKPICPMALITIHLIPSTFISPTQAASLRS